MDQAETPAENLDRISRLADRLIIRFLAGERMETLREHLSIAVMMSPLAEAEHARAFERFDDAVARAGATLST